MFYCTLIPYWRAVSVRGLVFSSCTCVRSSMRWGRSLRDSVCVIWLWRCNIIRDAGPCRVRGHRFRSTVRYVSVRCTPSCILDTVVSCYKLENYRQTEVTLRRTFACARSTQREAEASRIHKVCKSKWALARHGDLIVVDLPCGATRTAPAPTEPENSDLGT